jgi:hypothetical protein
MVLILCTLVGMAMSTVDAAYRYAHTETAKREPHPKGPDVSTCPDNITLWECVQHARYEDR